MNPKPYVMHNPVKHSHSFYFTMVADVELVEIARSTEGVCGVGHVVDTKYTVHIDDRYAPDDVWLAVMDALDAQVALRNQWTAALEA